jgi:hypothetical protein
MPGPPGPLEAGEGGERSSRDSMPSDSGRDSGAGAEGAPPTAELRTHASMAAGTLWLTQSPTLSFWKGEVGLPDWLRIETREGAVIEMRLEPRGTLRLGRLKTGMAEAPHLQSELFVSSQAAVLRHDGVRWWLRRRRECHERVPTVVGGRVLAPGEEAPLVHGTFVQVGKARGTFVDRRYVVPTMPAGAVDQHTGLLARVGFEQEIAGFVSLGKRGAIAVVSTSQQYLAVTRPGEHPPLVRAALALHLRWPRLAIMHEQALAALLVPEEAGGAAEVAALCRQLCEEAGLSAFATGYWELGAKLTDAAKELELATLAAQGALSAGQFGAPLALRGSALASRISTPDELRAALAADRRRPVVLFAIEESGALGHVGPHVLPALEQELSAVVAGRASPRATVARLAPGVIGACTAPGGEYEAFASEVQREWHFRPPVVDGKIELPRSLCWEIHGGDPFVRAAELSRECADPQGVLQALSGGLPYPVAGRVALAVAASSAVERVKLLFDVLEGSWRLVAAVLAAAYFTAPFDPSRRPAGWAELASFTRGLSTRHAYPLGKWRELARLVARALSEHDDTMGQMARELLRVKHEGNETLEALANQLHPMRNQFAHNVYPEARARQDLPAFEQITREFLRALRPLCAWTLVTIEKTEPDLYGDTQMVEYIDHTGPSGGGTRRRVGLKSPVRLANVVYLVRWRDGLVVPLEPFLRRRPHGNAFDLFWIQHLPRPGQCAFTTVVDGDEQVMEVEERRLPPRLRELLSAAQPGPAQGA